MVSLHGGRGTPMCSCQRSGGSRATTGSFRYATGPSQLGRWAVINRKRPHGSTPTSSGGPCTASPSMTVRGWMQASEDHTTLSNLLCAPSGARAFAYGAPARRCPRRRDRASPWPQTSLWNGSRVVTECLEIRRTARIASSDQGSVMCRAPSLWFRAFAASCMLLSYRPRDGRHRGFMRV